MRCLICYDITAPRRSQRVVRHMQQHARAVQLSIFLFEGNKAAFERCLDGLKKRIDPKKDDVRIYAIGSPTQLIMAGLPLEPEGVWLSGPI